MLYASNGVLSRSAIHCPERRNSRHRNAWALFSGKTNYGQIVIMRPSITR